MSDRTYIEIPGDRTHELPPLLIHGTTTGNATQLDEVCQVLNRHSFRYDVEDDFISFDGRPAEAMINFRPGTDPAAVQTILDDCR